MSEYFPKPKTLGETMKVKLDLSNYVTKADLKNPASVDASDFAKRTDLAYLKSELDKLISNYYKFFDGNTSRGDIKKETK